MRAHFKPSIQATCGRGFVLPTTQPSPEAAKSYGTTSWQLNDEARHRRTI